MEIGVNIFDYEKSKSDERVSERKVPFIFGSSGVYGFINCMCKRCWETTFFQLHNHIRRKNSPTMMMISILIPKILRNGRAEGKKT